MTLRDKVGGQRLSNELDEWGWWWLSENEEETGLGRGGVEGFCRKCGEYSNNLVKCVVCDQRVCRECLAEQEPDDIYLMDISEYPIEICQDCADYWELLGEEELVEPLGLSDEELAHVREVFESEMMEEKSLQVMDIILKKIKPGTFFKTPSLRAKFMVKEVDPRGVTFRVGKGGWLQIRVPSKCLNGVPDFLKGKGWVLIGARHDRPSPKGSFDEYLKRFVKPREISAASYVVPILERILLVQVDTREPAKIRLIK